MNYSIPQSRQSFVYYIKIMYGNVVNTNYNNNFANINLVSQAIRSFVYFDFDESFI